MSKSDNGDTTLDDPLSKMNQSDVTHADGKQSNATHTQANSLKLTDFFALCQQRVQNSLERSLAGVLQSNNLQRAMAYATLNGGKRIRPILAYASALAMDGSLELADDAACAVELIHCYSLVHDDLPAMDDDDLRRGQPTVHKAFDEATAILVGDALQTTAFGLLSQSENALLNPHNRLRMIARLSEAAGANGMVAGQVMDFEATGRQLNLAELQAMHRLKTGALISASVELGALSAPNPDQERLAALISYGSAIGLAFQIQDDILDETADTDTLGKPQGSDRAHHKPTYTSLLGLQGAISQANVLLDESIASLSRFSDNAAILRQLAHYIIERSH